MKSQTSAAPLRAGKPVVRKPVGALQRAADASSTSQSLSTLQLMADARAPVQRMDEDEMQMKPIQLFEEDELQGKFIQRMEEDELQMKPIQRIEDEDLLQGKLVQRAEAQAPKVNNTGLPDNLKSGIENLSGMSMDHVRVHRNSDKPATVQAHAYAQGSNIHLAPGQEQHLPHEAWHVVQQAQGRVKPTMQMKGVAVNDDPGLEHEADVMGAKALQMHKFGATVATTSTQVTNQIVAQRTPVSDNGYTPKNSSATFLVDHVGTLENAKSKSEARYGRKHIDTNTVLLISDSAIKDLVSDADFSNDCTQLSGPVWKVKVTCSHVNVSIAHGGSEMVGTVGEATTGTVYLKVYFGDDSKFSITGISG